MTTLGQVKINGQYDTVSTSAPTTAQKTPAYLNGHRWLNLTTGFSYQLTDEDAGTWTQIETGLDGKINVYRTSTFNRVFAECADGLMIQRTVALEESPDSITRNALYRLGTFVSIYANWTISGASVSVDDVDDIIGSLEDFEYEDEVYIYGSSRNDGVHQIASVDAAGLTFDEALVGNGQRFLIALVSTPTDLELIIGRMIYYDVVTRPQFNGLKSERIGTYSYERMETVGGMEYPSDVVAGIGSYLSQAPIADAEWIP